MFSVALRAQMFLQSTHSSLRSLWAKGRRPTGLATFINATTPVRSQNINSLRYHSSDFRLLTSDFYCCAPSGSLRQAFA